jgi:gliding motility-associated-like protein
MIRIVNLFCILFLTAALKAQHTNMGINPLMTEALPTAFSPNGDGINDSFEIRRFVRTDVTVDSFLIKIYNRYGELVFESSSLSKSWDGTNKKGNKLPVDAYPYVIYIRTTYPDEQKHKGTITLIR